MDFLGNMPSCHFKLTPGILSLASFLLWLSLEFTDGAVYDLYNTKIATSDLRWTKEPRNSWEEVSGFDSQNNVIRSYQICQLSRREKNNWLRSPFINTRGARRVNVEIEFSIAKCDWPGVDTDHCRQTFNLLYYESEKDVASSTFPPWQERPYIKVDTVAANSNDQINKKTFTIELLKSNGGIYVAAQDQGACMSLISFRVYHYYCPETTRSLATFERTITGAKTASLVTVPGNCVPNAEKSSEIVPKYYCVSTGEWQIITGSCKCTAGYHPNAGFSACLACPIGTFKTTSGNGKCTKCPTNSGPIDEDSANKNGGATALVKISSQGLAACPCHPGSARAKYESISKPCTKIPSTPIFGSSEVNTTSAIISWTEPLDLGGRSDLYYSISCQVCTRSRVRSCQDCQEKVSYPIRTGNRPEDAVSLKSLKKFLKTSIDVINLEPFTRYIFKIYARNGVSDTLGTEAPYLLVEMTTEESVPLPVTNIYVADTSLNSVIINWQTPASPRGQLLGYEVEVRLRSSVSRFSRASETTPSDEETAKPIIIETKKTSCTLDDLESDTEYMVRIRAKTSVGFGRHSASVMFRTSKRNREMKKSEGDEGAEFWIGAVIAVIALAIVCTLLVFYYSRRKAHSGVSKKGKGFAKPAPIVINRYNEVTEREQLTLQRRDSTPEGARKTYVDYPDARRAVESMNKEISPLNLRLHNTIGEGEFAVVYKATMMEGNEMKTVAAKQLKEGAGAKDKSNFLREACTMAQFDHPNILQLQGVITKHKPEMIISEYMENGSLHQFLKRRRGQLAMPQLLHMLRGIANGMRYLSDMQFIHRDLAARNILVNCDLVCKVSDFGLSRTLKNKPRATYTTQGGKIAIRWTAPECIRFCEFTSASDIWSYGIVMWEVMSYAEKPYWNMTNNDVMQSIGKGMRLPAPTRCPKALHQLMLECWSLDPKKRPTFSKIVFDLNKFIRHSSLLQVRQEEEMEQSVCCSPDAQDTNADDHTGESFIEDPGMSNQEERYSESDSFSVSQDDTCSSVVVTDERCLNV